VPFELCHENCAHKFLFEFWQWQRQACIPEDLSMTQTAIRLESDWFSFLQLQLYNNSQHENDKGKGCPTH
jgi:hypothetical protein